MMNNILSNFVKELAPPKEQLKKTSATVNELKIKLKSCINGLKDVEIVNMPISGSILTDTSLRKSASTTFDVDLEIYLLVKNSSSNILTQIANYLRKQYSENCVIRRKKTIMINFHGQNLSCDIIPVATNSSTNKQTGKLLDQSNDRGKISNRKSIEWFKEVDKMAILQLSQMVRLLKCWRNRHLLSFMTSFVIQCIVASYLKEHTPSTLTEFLNEIFVYMSQERWNMLKDKNKNKSVVLLPDPFYPSNNLVSNWNEGQRSAVVTAAKSSEKNFKEAKEHLRKGTATKYLQNIFGDMIVV